MRRWQFISITVLLFFVSCRNSIVVDSLTKVRPEFVSVYDLKDNYPESAYHVFCRIADTLDETKLHQKSSFLFHEYQVLKAELNYKNYRPIINDSLVEEAYGFYDSIFSGKRTAHKTRSWHSNMPGPAITRLWWRSRVRKAMYNPFPII